MADATFESLNMHMVKVLHSPLTLKVLYVLTSCRCLV